MSTFVRLERLPPAVLILSLLLASPGDAQRPRPASTGSIDGEPVALQPAAVPTWPVSAALLVSEVVTGGATASDEFVELYNAGTTAVDLSGHELVYVTATGGTVTRKQSWDGLVMEPGRHLLLANSSGVWASLADGLYSGGFAATGGSIVLRSLSGVVVDSLSWGDAASSFVEGWPGIAPPAGSSLERQPGGAAGNGVDTNDNAQDTRLEASPVGQGLHAAPVPAPSASPPRPVATSPATIAPDPTLAPEPTAIVDPTLPPEPTRVSDPTLGPDPTPLPTATTSSTAAPTATATPTATAAPPTAAAPTAAAPTATAPAATAAPSATAPPSPSAVPATPQPVLTVAAARALPAGSSATVSGALTTPLGLTETGKGAFIEDATAGIAIYLPSGDWSPLAAGTSVTVSGVIESRFSQLTLRLGAASDLLAGAAVPLPTPLAASTGSIAESVEGRLVAVAGTVSDGITTLTDGFSTALDDGSGGVRVVVAAATGIAPDALSRGARLALTGVAGQRDSTGTGTAGYRLHLRSTADIVPLPEPSPIGSPTPSPAPSAHPSPLPTPSPVASPTPAPVPSPSPSPSSAPSPAAPTPIATARTLELGVQLTVRGVVTVAAGRILGDSTIAIQDATGGICVRLPARVPGLVAGRLVEVSGVLAAPFGNLEVRPTGTGLHVLGSAHVPAPRALRTSGLGEATEGLLARLTGTIRRIDASETSITLIVEDEAGEGRVFIHRAVGLDRAHFSVGRRIEATGIVGDRSGLYRLWPREPSDVRLIAGGAGPTPSPGGTDPGGAGGGSGGGGGAGGGGGGGGGGDDRPPVITIAQALRRATETVTVEGTVTTPSGLLDADARRIALQDTTAAILVRLPADAQSVAVGHRLRVTGEIGTYFGAPQLGAEEPPARIGAGAPSAIQVANAPLPAWLEWRLVQISGEIVSVRRDGESWRAELKLDGGSIPIVGLARSGIASTALVAGRRATVRGVVKRAHPTAADQRFAIVPRSTGDVALGAAVSGQEGADGSAAPGQGPTIGGAGGMGVGDPAHSGRPGASASDTGALDVPLSELVAHVGESVRVGGRVEQRSGAVLVIDDGTASAILRLTGDAQPATAGIAPGALVNAVGTVMRTPDGGLEVVVDDPAHLRVASLPRAAAGATLAPVAPRAPRIGVPSTSQPAAARPPIVFVAGVLVLLAAAIGFGGLWFARRQMAARRTAQRVAARLEGRAAR